MTKEGRCAHYQALTGGKSQLQTSKDVQHTSTCKNSSSSQWPSKSMSTETCHNHKHINQYKPLQTCKAMKQEKPITRWDNHAYKQIDVNKDYKTMQFSRLNEQMKFRNQETALHNTFQDYEQKDKEVGRDTCELKPIKPTRQRMLAIDDIKWPRYCQCVE